MSVMDERRKLVVVGSIIGTFGIGSKGHDVLSQRNKSATVEPGPLELESSDDLEPLREMIWEDVTEDLDFASNKFVQVLSIPDDVLFESGGYEFKERGKRILETAMPVFLRVAAPLLLAGHTSSLRDEEGVDYRVEDMDQPMDSSWELSFMRVMKVYTFLVDNGMSPDMLRVEAFGRFHPRFGDSNPRDRRRNRRCGHHPRQAQRPVDRQTRHAARKGVQGLHEVQRFHLQVRRQAQAVGGGTGQWHARRSRARESPGTLGWSPSGTWSPCC